MSENCFLPTHDDEKHDYHSHCITEDKDGCDIHAVAIKRYGEDGISAVCRSGNGGIDISFQVWKHNQDECVCVTVDRFPRQHV